MSDLAAQMALDVDPFRTVVVTEARGSARRDLRVGPLPEPEARALIGLLLNRQADVEDDGPWRVAVAGGARTVRLEAR